MATADESFAVTREWAMPHLSAEERRRLFEAEQANAILTVHGDECSTWLKFDDAEREALAAHDYPGLFELGAHPFLTLTLFIAMFERDYAEPLGFQLEYAQRLSRFKLPYPDITT